MGNNPAKAETSAMGYLALGFSFRRFNIKSFKKYYTISMPSYLGEKRNERLGEFECRAMKI